MLTGPLATLLASVLAFAGGLASSYLISRGQKASTSIQAKSANTEQVEMIFDGYSQIVEDLQKEVERLKITIDDLRNEQEACEARNVAMHHELIDLRTRILLIESRDGDDNGK